MAVTHWLYSLTCIVLLLPSGFVVCSQRVVVIFPEHPIVRIGDPLILNCSTICPRGKPHWKIEDSDPYTEDHYDQYSVLNIQEVRQDDTFVSCSAHCDKKLKSAKVFLKVYSFPEPELVSVPESGQPFQVQCSLRRIFPSASVTMKLYRDDTVISQECHCDEDKDDDHFENCKVSVNDQTGSSLTEYKCEAMLNLGDKMLSKNTSLSLDLSEPANPTAPALQTTPSVSSAEPETIEMTTSRMRESDPQSSAISFSSYENLSPSSRHELWTTIPQYHQTMRSRHDTTETQTTATTLHLSTSKMDQITEMNTENLSPSSHNELRTTNLHYHHTERSRHETTETQTTASTLHLSTTETEQMNTVGGFQDGKAVYITLAVLLVLAAGGFLVFLIHRKKRKAKDKPSQVI